MAKYNRKWNGTIIERFIKEGRGAGEGTEYKPWLTIQDFPSRGRASRILGVKTRRVHHLFSDNQVNYFSMLEWNDNVIDIREHYPLLDYDDVVGDKGGVDEKYFHDSKTNIPYVISSSFLITLRKNGATHLFARAVKSASDLGKKVTIHRLEIERRYWEAKKIDWGVVTNKEIPKTKCRNIEWALDSIRNGDRFIDQVVANELRDKLCSSEKSIKKVIEEVTKKHGFVDGEALLIFKYLIATKQVKIDLNKRLDLNMKCSDVSVCGVFNNA